MTIRQWLLLTVLFLESVRLSAEVREKITTEKLLARMNEMGLKPEEYQFYLDLRKIWFYKTCRIWTWI